MRDTYEKCINILEKAVDENISITRAANGLNFDEGSVRKYYNRGRLQKDFENGKIDQQEYDYFLHLYSQKSNNQILVQTKPKSTNLNIDDKFDDRSVSWEERDEDGKILFYKFKILVRDEEPFTGEITRQQMEIIYQNYPYVTINNVSSYFPAYTFIQFKRILRVFNITKDHLFPKHWLEEKSPETLAELGLKAKAHAGYKKIVENKPLFIEKELRETQKKLLELEENREWVKEALLDLTKNSNIKQYSFTPKKINKKKALNIYLSDMHIGACNKNALFSGEYNVEVYYSRLKQVLQEVAEHKEIYGRFDTVHIVGLGDGIDGYGGSTYRGIKTGSHQLPQNLDNKEQFKTYVESMVFFIQEIYKMDMCNKLHFITVGESNHGADLEAISNQSLKYITEIKYSKEVFEFTLFEQAINHFNYGDSTFIITHGKDNEQMNKGLPLHINDRTDNYLGDYIRHNKIKSKNVYLLKGDLHQYGQSIGKNITRYISVGSLYGSSPWINANFGLTLPSTLIQVVDEETGKLTDTSINLI